jgi:hypothetical protein
MTGPTTTTCGLMYLKPKMRISFLRVPIQSDALFSFGLNIEIVQTIKLLGVIISSDLSWNAHVDYICIKASKRLYPLKTTNDLVPQQMI